MAINGERVLAVIPARGGSKRAPRKNIRLFRGQPLVSWAVHAARASRYIDKIIVSTEDREIKDVALLLGAEVMDRPAELATDTATNEDVLRHCMDTVRIHKRLSSPTLDTFDLIVLLQPTSPLRTAADIDACIEFARTGWGCISYNEETHQKNGAVYVAYADWLMKHDFSHAGLRRYDMPAERSLDIDYPEQFTDA